MKSAADLGTESRRVSDWRMLRGNQQLRLIRTPVVESADRPSGSGAPEVPVAGKHDADVAETLHPVQRSPRSSALAMA